MYLCISKLNNSWGRGWLVQAGMYDNHAYYGVSKREAVRLYRHKYNLVGKHLITVEW